MSWVKHSVESLIIWLGFKEKLVSQMHSLLLHIRCLVIWKLLMKVAWGFAVSSLRLTQKCSPAGNKTGCFTLQSEEAHQLNLPPKSLQISFTKVLVRLPFFYEKYFPQAACKVTPAMQRRTVMTQMLAGWLLSWGRGHWDKPSVAASAMRRIACSQSVLLSIRVLLWVLTLPPTHTRMLTEICLMSWK